MAAHPADLSCWCADDQRVVMDILGHDGTSSDERVAPDGHAGNNRGICTDRAPAPQHGLLIKRVADNLGSRIADVGQNAGRTEENVVFDLRSGVNRHVILNLDVVTDHDTAGNVAVLAENAAFADARTFHDVRVMPYFRARPNFTTLINAGRFVSEIGRSGRPCLFQLHTSAIVQRLLGMFQDGQDS